MEKGRKVPPMAFAAHAALNFAQTFRRVGRLRPDGLLAVQRKALERKYPALKK